MIIIGTLMQNKPLTRSFGLLCLIPVAQLGFNVLVLESEQVPSNQLASMAVLCIGSLMICLFADTSGYSRKQFSWFADRSSCTESTVRNAVLNMDGIEIRDNGRNSVIRLPVQKAM